MLEKIFDMMMWIDNAFTRTRDPLLAEYRSYQKQMVLSVVIAVIGLMGVWIVMPTSEHQDSFQELVQTIATYAALIFLTMSFVASLWCAWASYRLWRFTED